MDAKITIASMISLISAQMTEQLLLTIISLISAITALIISKTKKKK